MDESRKNLFKKSRFNLGAIVSFFFNNCLFDKVFFLFQKFFFFSFLKIFMTLNS